MRWVTVGSILALGACAASGQIGEAKLEFEVASVKPSAPLTDGRVFVGRGGGPGTQDPSRATYTNYSLKQLITVAYDVKPYQVTGPNWLDTERFDVIGKVPEGATKEQVTKMLQN